jgi:hypothetical protein
MLLISRTVEQSASSADATLQKNILTLDTSGPNSRFNTAGLFNSPLEAFGLRRFLDCLKVNGQNIRMRHDYLLLRDV